MKVLLGVVLICALGAIAVAWFIDAERTSNQHNIDKTKPAAATTPEAAVNAEDSMVQDSVNQVNQHTSNAIVIPKLTQAEVSRINAITTPAATATNKPLPTFSTGVDSASKATSSATSSASMEVIKDVSLAYRRSTKIVSSAPDISMDATSAGIPERIKTNEILSELARSGRLIDGTEIQDITAQQLRENALFGDPSQPGYQLQQQIIETMDEGANFIEALTQVMNNAINPTRTMLDDNAFTVVDNDFDLAVDFMQLMALTNDLSPVIIELMNLFPEFSQQNIELGVSLYPAYAQDVLNAAAQGATIDPDSALLAALSAGADPTDVSATTAAGLAQPQGVGIIAPTAAPLGAGIGAGGTGGGDTTGSTN